MGQAKDSEFAKKSGWNEMADDALGQAKESGGGFPRFAGKAFGLGNTFGGGGASASFLDQARGN